MPRPTRRSVRSPAPRARRRQGAAPARPVRGDRRGPEDGRTAPPPRDAHRGARPARAAARPCASTASSSPACSAWCASLASSGSPAGGDASRRRIAACSARRRCGGIALSIASRASSWRKATPSRSSRSMPEPMHGPSASISSATIRSSSQSSVQAGTTATTSSSRRAAASSEAARASTASRTVARERRLAGCEHLRDVERVPARQLEDRLGVAAVGLGEAPYGVEGERRDGAARDRRGRGELAEQQPERVVVGELVPVRGEHERLRAVDPPAEHAQHVERRLVRPVHVLQHGHRWHAELGRERERDLPRRAPASTRVANVPPTCGTRSMNGPSGVGVVSASQPPRSTRASVRSQNARTSDVLPTPASPPTNTSRPDPAAASSASSPSRSSRPVPVTPGSSSRARERSSAPRQVTQCYLARVGTELAQTRGGAAPHWIRARVGSPPPTPPARGDPAAGRRLDAVRRAHAPRRRRGRPPRAAAPELSMRPRDRPPRAPPAQAHVTTTDVLVDIALLKRDWLDLLRHGAGTLPPPPLR